MRIIIDIPKEFEEHFKQDKFENALHRLSDDAHLMAGNYEQETALMLIKAFDESIHIDRIVEQLEERRKDYERSVQNAVDDVSAAYRKGVMRGYEYSRDLVKAGGKV